MPKAKPNSLNNRHNTKAEKEERESAESAMTPITELTVTPPAVLLKHKPAIETWKRLIGLYFEVEGKIITAFDADLLAKYCLLEEECVNMQGLRDVVLKEWARISAQLEKTKPKGEEMKTYFKLMGQLNALLARYQGLDARLDGKRKLLHALAQSLYLTPRSRAGVAPTTKPPAEPDDPTEKVLNGGRK